MSGAGRGTRGLGGGIRKRKEDPDSDVDMKDDDNDSGENVYTGFDVDYYWNNKVIQSFPVSFKMLNHPGLYPDGVDSRLYREDRRRLIARTTAALLKDDPQYNYRSDISLEEFISSILIKYNQEYIRHHKDNDDLIMSELEGVGDYSEIIQDLKDMSNEQVRTNYLKDPRRNGGQISATTNSMPPPTPPKGTISKNEIGILFKNYLRTKNEIDEDIKSASSKKKTRQELEDQIASLQAQLENCQIAINMQVSIYHKEVQKAKKDAQEIGTKLWSQIRKLDPTIGVGIDDIFPLERENRDHIRTRLAYRSKELLLSSSENDTKFDMKTKLHRVDRLIPFVFRAYNTAYNEDFPRTKISIEEGVNKFKAGAE
jgi:hypothetical protein